MAFVARAVVVCDDFRREDNGKELLIGVYSGELNVATFPSNLHLFFYLIMQADEVGEWNLKLRILGPNNVQLIHGEASVVVGRPGDLGIALGPMPLQVQSPGHIALEIQLPNEGWQEVKRLPIRGKALTN